MTSIPADETASTPTSGLQPVRRALLSVSDKQGLAEFAAGLAARGIELYSTGGTRRHLIETGIEVQDVAEYTAFPEMMDGRVKTLHPRIFGGILSRRDVASDRAALEEHGILEFDLVVVNLYPFRETIAKPGVTRGEAIENIDIGGPSLVRAAAKNSRFVTIATSPDQYAAIADDMTQFEGCTRQALRDQLMAAAFRHTAEYDRMIADYFGDTHSDLTQSADDRSAGKDPSTPSLPSTISLNLTRHAELRYGENPHQAAALYRVDGDPSAGFPAARKLNGKELSYNNLLDLNSALTIVASFPEAACVVIKHNNPCGAAAGSDLADVVRRAMEGDPTSAFGSVLAINRTVDEVAARQLAEGNYFIECIVAPEFDDEAVRVLTTVPKWKKNVRLIAGDLPNSTNARIEYRAIHGGMLVQQSAFPPIETEHWHDVNHAELDSDLIRELAFAWNMVRFVKSNAIVLGRECSLVGVGAGQMSRVDSVHIAIEKAADRAAGSVLASDAFFPFPDSIALAAEAGVRAIVQPGGSVKDPEVIDAARQHGIPMVMTGERFFLH